MVGTFLTVPWSTLGWVALSTLVAYVAVIAYTRVVGLRSFAKMSSFDFAATIAMGSVIASTAVLSSVSIARGAAALALLFAFQAVVAWLRIRSRRLERWIDNAPLVLMAGPEILHDHLRAGKVTHDDLRAKLREHGVVRRDQVRLVILETTGDISVLTGTDEVEPWLLEDVRGQRQLQRDVLGRDG